MASVHTIDATGKPLGRIAAEAASVLMGKNSVAFAKNRIPDVEVRIANAAKLAISERKASAKTYSRYSGYPGGLKQESFSALTTRHGFEEAVRRAVSGMLPKNRSRQRTLKNLRFV